MLSPAGTLRRFAAGEGVGIWTYHRVDAVRRAGEPGPPGERDSRRVLAAACRPDRAWFSAAATGGADTRISPRPYLAAQVILVTFDDGYQNNCDYAWPVLKRHQVPATIFLVTRYVGSHPPFPFEDWQPAIRREVEPATGNL